MPGMPPRTSGDPEIPDLRELRSVLPRGRQGRVAVLLAHEGVAERLAVWLTELRRYRVVVLTPDPGTLTGYDVPVRAARTLDEITHQLRLSGAVDVVVDLLSHDRLPDGCLDHRALVTTVLPHLARNGAFVHDRVAAPGVLEDATDGLIAVLDDGADPALGEDVGNVAVTRELLVVTQRHRRFLMLREADVPDVLVAREPQLTVDELAALPEGDFVARTTVHHHGEPPAVAPMRPVLHHPRLVTRHYRGPVRMSGRTLMSSGGTVLPDSFRWHLAASLSNPFLDDPVGELARLKRRHPVHRSIEGDFYQLESSYPSHFGHVMTEVVSRM